MDPDSSLLSTASYDEDTITGTARNPLLNFSRDASSTVTPLEQDVLDEYARLLENMNQLSSTLQDLSTGPLTLSIAETLRLLERKVASVYTLLRASVYSIVLSQQQEPGMGGGEGVSGISAGMGYEGE